jgi:hypothetical protein
MNKSNLDKGDACIQSLLISLHSLLSPPLLSSSSNSSSSSTTLPARNEIHIQMKKRLLETETKFIHEFVNYIQNCGLIIGIVQNCIQCFDFASINTSTSSISINTIRSNDNDIRGNVELKLIALNLLKTLLELSLSCTNSSSTTTNMSVKDPNLDNDKFDDDPIVICFQKIFPSCFAVSLNHDLDSSVHSPM